MKKQKSDISKRVMGKVVTFEEKRLSFFLWNYRSILMIIFISAVAIGIGLYWELVTRKAFDLLSLFAEDREIIAEYWADTLTMFYEEIPREYIVSLGICFALVFIVIFFTKPIRIKLQRILVDIAKFKRNES